MNITTRHKTVVFSSSELEGSIGARFEKIVEAFGSKEACVDSTRALTYDKLNELANRIAHALVKKEGRQSCRVGIFLDQGGWNFASAIGVLKAGKCYIPLDPLAPVERLREYIRMADIRCILTISEHSESLEKLRWPREDTIFVESIDPSDPGKNLDLNVSPDAEGYIIFTSGSTGEPKGVVQPHRSILHNALSLTRELCVTSEDRQSMLYTPAVFGAQREMFLGLLNGTTTFFYPTREKGVTELAGWINDNQITMYASVVTVFRRLVGHLREDETFDTVRIIKLGGEATYWSDVDLFFEHFSIKCKLFCGFSMTETNLLTSMFIDRNQTRSGDRAPLGKVIEGKKISVIRSDGSEAEPGQTGEICVRSRYISTGYTGDRDLNELKFQSDPDDPTMITFNTGDLGYFDKDGILTFEGRMDHQVKIRGYRVDLIEVEAAISGLDDIQECVVKTHEYSDHELRIVAYIVFNSRSTLSIAQIRITLSEKLSSYMVPSHFVILSEIPQTSSGKVDRQALSRPDVVSRQDPASYSAPRNETEMLLKTCWESWLGLSDVGIDDDFFELGGDSLSATQLLLDIDETFKVTFGPEEIFNECNTIRGMSKRLLEEGQKPFESTGSKEGDEACVQVDIDFVDGKVNVSRTNRPELYRIDARSGLRVGRPNCESGSIRLNNLGFRSPNMEIRKSENVIRIAFLGSSSVFDPRASSNEHTWPYLVVERLRAQCPNRTIEFVNAALPGSSTVRIRKMFENFVEELKPDLIILRTNDMNNDTAYIALEQNLYGGIPFKLSKFGKKFKLFLLIEKNLIIFWRILLSIS